jgi:hypothetical protein
LLRFSVFLTQLFMYTLELLQKRLVAVFSIVIAVLGISEHKETVRLA